MNDLWPVTTRSPSCSLIVVVIAFRSEPTSGSVSASAAIASHPATAGSHRLRTASLPPATIG